MCRSYSLQRRIISKLWRLNEYMLDRRWFHLMLAIFRWSSFLYARMKRAEEACGTVDFKGWIEVFIFFLQSILKESPVRGLWAHWIAEISGFPFYSLYFEFSSVGVKLEMISCIFFFPFFCVAVSFMNAYHFMPCNADPESIFASSQKFLNAFSCTLWMWTPTDGWSHACRYERIDGCMTTRKRVWLLTFAFLPPLLPRPCGPKDVR